MSDQDAGARPPLTIVPKPTRAAPAHAGDLRAVPVPGSPVTVERSALFDIIDKLKVLTPCDRNPERFHERKDDLVAELYAIATA